MQLNFYLAWQKLFVLMDIVFKTTKLLPSIDNKTELWYLGVFCFKMNTKDKTKDSNNKTKDNNKAIDCTNKTKDSNKTIDINNKTRQQKKKGLTKIS